MVLANYGTSHTRIISQETRLSDKRLVQQKDFGSKRNGHHSSRTEGEPARRGLPAEQCSLLYLRSDCRRSQEEALSYVNIDVRTQSPESLLPLFSPWLPGFHSAGRIGRKKSSKEKKAKLEQELLLQPKPQTKVPGSRADLGHVPLPSRALPGTFAPRPGLIHLTTPLRPGELKALFITENLLVLYSNLDEYPFVNLVGKSSALECLFSGLGVRDGDKQSLRMERISQRMTGDGEGEREGRKSESLGASDDLFTNRDCMRGMNVALCAGQTVGSNKESYAAQAQGLQMSGSAPLTPGLHRQQAAVVRERQAASERLGGGQWAENKKEPLSQPVEDTTALLTIGASHNGEIHRSLNDIQQVIVDNLTTVSRKIIKLSLKIGLDLCNIWSNTGNSLFRSGVSVFSTSCASFNISALSGWRQSPRASHHERIGASCRAREMP
ncbi:hypothetical protein FQN60_003821 [Etheostoma spectabile]|uniref:Uncharacterized protein n=1 Tax=Etheostoma spectabile TaxID=54343 RepID=A0A5J5CLL3_9PERO|nr:hypothetical protein FQN60_006278 [Etheostoma spectabile]KAA8585127.1 hypothetical protein FQN60_003821 [Etheostoma spectabile]